MAETESKGSRASSAASTKASRGDGDVKRAFQEAHRAYYMALQNAHLQSQRPFVDAYTGYLQAVGKASPQEPLNTVYAYHDYVRNVLEAQHGADTYKAYDDAYRDYVRAVKEAFAALDEESADPASLAAVAESLRAGAAMAQSSVRR